MDQVSMMMALDAAERIRRIDWRAKGDRALVAGVVYLAVGGLGRTV
jgi:hypothetical protein